MREKERLQCDTNVMSSTSAVLLNDEEEEEVRKNSKVGKRNDSAPQSSSLTKCHPHALFSQLLKFSKGPVSRRTKYSMSKNTSKLQKHFNTRISLRITLSA